MGGDTFIVIVMLVVMVSIIVASTIVVYLQDKDRRAEQAEAGVKEIDTPSPMSQTPQPAPARYDKYSGA